MVVFNINLSIVIIFMAEEEIRVDISSVKQNDSLPSQDDSGSLVLVYIVGVIIRLFRMNQLLSKVLVNTSL